MSNAQQQRILELARIWGEFAARTDGQGFESRFLADLERVSRFQTAHPGQNPSALLEALEIKVFREMRTRFSMREIYAAYTRLDAAGSIRG